MAKHTLKNSSSSKGLDFSKGVRGKYYEHAKAALHVRLLDLDLVGTFPDSASVNAALRLLKEVAERAAIAKDSDEVVKKTKRTSAAKAVRG